MRGHTRHDQGMTTPSAFPAAPARTPREHLVDAFRTVAPTAPTVCEGWQARHLAAHVLLRERSMLRLGRTLAAGRDLAFEEGEKVTDLAAYEALIDLIAEGPGRLSPMGWSPAINTLEFEVHAMDIERGTSLPEQQKVLPEPVAGALWSSVRAASRLRFARADSRGGVGLIFVVPDGPRSAIARGGRSAIITGTVAELALVASGRARVSLASVSGPDSAVVAVTESLGFDQP